jgi:Anti-sigma-K factor rskA/Putative zinc-finger
MKCAQIHPNLAAFALGGLEPEEASEIRRHLASCPGCQNELRELQKVNRALEAAPPPADPPSHLKEVVLSRVRAEVLSPSDNQEPEESSSLKEQTGSSRSSRFNRFKDIRIILPSVAAAAVVGIVALGAVFGLLREEPPVATIQLVPTSQEAATLQGYWGVAEIRPQPSGNQQVELKLNNFEEPKPNSYYELWFVSGQRGISAGSFTSVGQGETRVLLNIPPEASNYNTLLITEERIDDDFAPSEEVALKGEMP